jgi:hypothetical protein
MRGESPEDLDMYRDTPAFAIDPALEGLTAGGVSLYSVHSDFEGDTIVCIYSHIDSRVLSLIHWQVDSTQPLPPSNGGKEGAAIEIDTDSLDEVRKYVIPHSISN